MERPGPQQSEPQQSEQTTPVEPVIDLAMMAKRDNGTTPSSAPPLAFVNSAGGIGAACVEPLKKPHPPVPGRALLRGASKLSYGPPQAAGNDADGSQGQGPPKPAAPARGKSRAELESRPSAAAWQQWSGDD
ncbi:hypothetical protein ACK3TF_000298 [Chlorella vulgaris]